MLHFHQYPGPMIIVLVEDNSLQLVQACVSLTQQVDWDDSKDKKPRHSIGLSGSLSRH